VGDNGEKMTGSAFGIGWVLVDADWSEDGMFQIPTQPLAHPAITLVELSHVKHVQIVLGG
jgi:hypothetical protein